MTTKLYTHYFFYGVRWLPLPILRLLATILSIFVFSFWVKRRRVVVRNLQLCFPQWSRLRRWFTSWRVFQKAMQMLFDYSWLWYGTFEQFDKRVSHQGYLQTPASGTACLYFVPHFMGMACVGNWLGRQNVSPLHYLVRSQNSSGFNQIYQTGLTRFGRVTLIDKEQGIRPLVRALRNQDSVVILPDLNVGATEAEFVPFFKQWAATSPVLGRLAKIVGVPIIPIIPILHKKGYHLHILPALALDSHQDSSYALKMNQFLELWISQYPEQYWWLHRRFKTRPNGEGSLY
ncbi:MAG: hypothetical protein QM520_06930 [Gammaproteobacteria bacterium]|nr:hypothetical protein [Gammaproteobacteria bacterium]